MSNRASISIYFEREILHITSYISKLIYKVKSEINLEKAILSELKEEENIVHKMLTAAEAIEEYIPLVDMVLVMTVEPGFGGQKFMADMMPKVKQIRAWIDEKNLNCDLEVDGGVDPVTCKVVIENGANVLVAGSAVYKAEDIPARIAELRG